MGSLFSSSADKPPARSKLLQEQNSLRSLNEYALRRSSEIHQSSSRAIYQHSTAPSTEKYNSLSRYPYNNINNTYIQQIKQLRPNVDLKLYKFLLTENLWQDLEDRSTVRLKLLDINSPSYEEASNTFRKTTQRHFVVVKIYEVQNPFMLGFYLLKKEEMKKKFGKVDEKLLFHGTKSDNIRKIIENNLDWRLRGLSKGHIFGQGVSFTPISCYASNYSDKVCNVKVMILAKVLVSKTTIGNENMVIPPLLDNYSRYRYDTTIKPNWQVFVKYTDNEFYPKYVIHYTGQQVKSVKY